MSVRVLADYHHSDLFESYQLTLGDRFGWDVRRPIGMEWFDRWYWSFERAHHGDAVARQYLSVWPTDRDLGTHLERDDTTHPGRVLRMLTVDQAREWRPQLVIASVPENYHGLSVFAAEVGAAFAVQVGNQWQDLDFPAATRAALVSTTVPFSPRVPSVTYRQEFSLADFRFEPAPRAEPFRVASFVQCHAENPKAHARLLGLARAEPSLAWSCFGSYGSHEVDELAAGNLPTTPRVAEAMRATDVIWHDKEWSDGYGHVVHNAFAVGRPVFGVRAYYADKLAAPLWVDGETCVDIGPRSDAEVLDRLRRLREDPGEHARMCEAAARRFREVVDFDGDAERVRSLLEGALA